MVSILISKFIIVYFLIDMVIFIIVIAPLPVCRSWLWLVVFINDYF